jgi:hypothetical protein
MIFIEDLFAVARSVAAWTKVKPRSGSGEFFAAQQADLAFSFWVKVYWKQFSAGMSLINVGAFYRM